MNMLKVKRGDTIAKVIVGAGCKTASKVEVTGVRNKGQIILLNGETDIAAGVSSYNAMTRRAVASYIPGFYTYLATIEEVDSDPSIEWEE